MAYDEERRKNPLKEWIPIFLIVPVVTLYSIIITGCLSDSPGLHNVYVLNLVDISGLEVRVGYFGICVESSTKRICGSASNIQTDFPTLQQNEALDPDNSGFPKPATSDILDIATTFQRRIQLPIITVAGVIFVISIAIQLALTWRDKSESPNRTQHLFYLYRTFIILTVLSIVFIVMASFTTVSMVNAIKYFRGIDCGQGTFQIGVGKILLGLQLATMSIQAIHATFFIVKVLESHGNWY
ncbi:hypothetical protein DTO166G4_7147 [Paecilomyces variotii]|nr:hypothetical protein DTO166G4_7147 [Paecilomyces variotii]KAJ9227703.1 hypothetical protein DTO166G5_9250 [Paecilomyces variotii]KAJ9261920.1 hypothetical protein DTO195F2_3908 [Paecilomyces variotii]KAJ9398852.1 hypothetical protein DTO282F9_4204 [Paecilomyces variotii]